AQPGASCRPRPRCRTAGACDRDEATPTGPARVRRRWRARARSSPAGSAGAARGPVRMKRGSFAGERTMAAVPDPQNREREHEAGPSRAVVLAPTLLGLLAIAINAWLCDDAFITLRTAKYLVEGRRPGLHAV